MAFFKFRKSGDDKSATPAQPESVEAMRRRAKYRLIGAAVMVLAGVIGFPMLFDKQPRPISVDMPIEIPDKNKVKPLNIPAPAATPVNKVDKVEVIETEVEPAEKIIEKPTPTPVIPAHDAPKNVAKSGLKSADKTADKPVAKPVSVTPPVTKLDESAKAKAILEGTAPEKKADSSEGRFVVQVGAFADATRAREVRLKLEHAGLKTYTHVAQTKEGARIRVRVGPFSNKVDADKAAQKIKKIDLPATILTL